MNLGLAPHPRLAQADARCPCARHFSHLNVAPFHPLSCRVDLRGLVGERHDKVNAVHVSFMRRAGAVVVTHRLTAPKRFLGKRLRPDATVHRSLRSTLAIDTTVINPLWQVRLDHPNPLRGVKSSEDAMAKAAADKISKYAEYSATTGARLVPLASTVFGASHPTALRTMSLRDFDDSLGTGVPQPERKAALAAQYRRAICCTIITCNARLWAAVDAHPRPAAAAAPGGVGGSRVA